MSATHADAVDAAQLYELCRSATGPAQADAYDRLGGLLYRLLLPRVSSDPRLENLAADAAQEALITIWRELDAGRGPDAPASFVSWSVRIAVNKMLDMRRRLEPSGRARTTKRVAVSRQLRMNEPDRETGRELGDRVADPATIDPETSVASEELHDVLASIGGLDSVSEKSKTVILRGYVEGWTDDELAELLHTSRGNVHVIRCRDLQRLRSDRSFMDSLRAVTGSGGESDTQTNADAGLVSGTHTGDTRNAGEGSDTGGHGPSAMAGSTGVGTDSGTSAGTDTGTSVGTDTGTGVDTNAASTSTAESGDSL